jgi:hypothetical protein
MTRRSRKFAAASFTEATRTSERALLATLFLGIRNRMRRAPAPASPKRRTARGSTQAPRRVAGHAPRADRRRHRRVAGHARARIDAGTSQSQGIRRVDRRRHQPVARHPPRGSTQAPASRKPIRRARIDAGPEVALHAQSLFQFCFLWPQRGHASISVMITNSFGVTLARQPRPLRS